jgi:hypothetical protein
MNNLDNTSKLKYVVSFPKITKKYDLRNTDLIVYEIDRIVWWPMNPTLPRYVYTSKLTDYSKKKPEKIISKKEFSGRVGTQKMKEVKEFIIPSWDGSTTGICFETLGEALQWKIKAIEAGHAACVNGIDKMKESVEKQLQRVLKSQIVLKESNPEYFL